jgi:hypothetical protein
MGKHLIRHYGRYIYRHEDYQAICQGDDCAAQILSLFEFWTSCRIEEIRRVQSYNDQNKKNTSLVLQVPTTWLYETTEDISIGILNAYGDSSIRKSIKKLLEWGFLDSRSSKNAFDRTKEYRFNTDLIQTALDQWNNENESVKAESIDKSDPLEITQESLEITQESLEITQESLEITQESLEITQESVNLKDDLYSLNIQIKQSDLTVTSLNGNKNASSREELTQQISANPDLKEGISDKQINLSLDKAAPAAPARLDKANAVEPFGRPRKSAKDIAWEWLPDGPWKKDGQLDNDFWQWFASEWAGKFGTDIHESRANVYSHLKKDHNNLEIRWKEYSIKTKKEGALVPLPDAVLIWQPIQHQTVWEQYINCKSLEDFYSKRSWNQAYLEYALINQPRFDWSKHLPVSA